jgi:hypothetical protein
MDNNEVASLIAKAGLGSLDEIYDAAERFFDQRVKSNSSLQDNNLQRIRTNFFEMGRELLRWRRCRFGEVGALGEYIIADMPSPLVITNDCEELRITSHGAASGDGDLLHMLDTRVRELTRAALRAGRGLDFGYSDYVY